MGATADDVPATERVCKHAVDIESLDARGILAALGASDKELYASESTCAQPALSHPKILNDVGELADGRLGCQGGWFGNLGHAC